MSRYPRPLPYVDFASRGGKPLWQPRIGLAWDLTGNGKSVARAGFGTAYQVFFNGNQGNELVALLQNNINITNPSDPDPFGGRDPITFVSTAPPNVGIMANDLKNAPTTTSSVGFSQQLMTDTAINVDGVIQHTAKSATDHQRQSAVHADGRASAAGVGADHDDEDDRQLRLQGVPGSPGEAAVERLS